MIIHPLAKKMLQWSVEKESNLILAADVETAEQVGVLALACQDYICGLKIHADTIDGFSIAWVQKLKQWALQHKIMLIEDRKFADIGNTQWLQLTKGYFQIASWADMVTCHFIAGEASFSIFERTPHVGLLGVLEMSTTGSLATATYTEHAKRIMKRYASFFVGAIAQGTSLEHPFLKCTPGIHLEQRRDDSGQAYQQPQHTLLIYETDMMIVGRGIYQSSNPAKVAENYRQLGWQVRGEFLTQKLMFL